MFLTKKDVDKHCQEVMSKCKSEKDRNLRCLNLAQQYYNVRDFESARRYIISFLSVKDDSPVAHKLYAQCLEYFGEKDKALSEFKYSLSLDPKQPELYLKVCELYADSTVVVDKNEAKYWHDKAEAQFPYHPAVLKLKKKMFAIGESQNGMSIESILLDEVKEKPNDATINAKLLNFYIDNGRFREAYDQAFKQKNGFVPNLFWYQSCVQICKSYRNQFPTSLNEEFYGNYLLSLERSLALSVQDVKMRRVSIPEGVELLASYDEALAEAADLSKKSEHLLLILNHMYGQLCFHSAHILYRKAKWEDNNWPEMIKLISPLLLLCTDKRYDIRRAKEEGPLSQVLKICILNNFSRIQQTGYILTALVKQSPKHFFEKIFHFCVGNYWKERICEIIYSTSNLKTFSKTSFFMKFDGFSRIPDELPVGVTDDIDQFLSVAETLYPSSLHHLVWIGVQYLNISNKNSICDAILPLKFTLKFTGSLQFAPNSSSSYAENLCTIDIEAFLFACVYCAKSLLDHQIDKNKPLGSYILPADVSRQLCSPEQDLWWDYVNQMINQTIAEEHYSRARASIQRGIESIRLTRNNILPLQLLVLLGRTFANKATVESDSVRASALESRSLLYWKAAVPMLEKAARKESYLTAFKSMFEYQENIITAADATRLVAEGKRFMGMMNCKEKNYCDSIFVNESFEETKPGTSASFSQVAQSSYSADDALLKTLLAQNTKIMDKLETLFNKQELLSSNQFQLFETISALAKKIDDVLIMPNDCYLDELSANEQPPSPHPPAPVVKTTPKPAPAVPAQPLIGSSLYPLPPGVLTNFPMFQPSNTPPAVPATYSLLSQTLQTPPQTSLQNFQFIPDTKESFSSASRSIASSSLFGAITAPTSTPARNQTTFSPAAPFAETSAHSTPQPFTEPKSFLPFAQSVKPSDTLNTSAPNFSFTLPGKTSLFQQVTAYPLSYGATAPPHPYQVPNVANPLFPAVQVPEDEDSDSDEYPAEIDPIPDFKPIIPLPDEVEVKTGEEGEEVLFEDRAKLFRFVDKEWKERGIGPFKILKNPANGRVRILMRREVVHKICANHFLLQGMNLVAKGDRAWVYCAMDFADEKSQSEQLCVKFKTPEVAEEFRRVFNENKMAGTTAPTSAVEKAQLTPAKAQLTPASTQLTPASAQLTPGASPQSTSSPVAPIGEGAKKLVIAPPVLSVQSPKEKVAEPNKTQFGGFTFSAQPILSAAVEKKKPAVVEEEKKMPFASFSGFSLGSLTRSEGESKLFAGAAVPALAASAVQPSVPPFAANEKSPMFSAGENALDFSNLSKNADGSAFAKSKDFKGFAGAGAPVFGAKAAQTKADDKLFSPATSMIKSSPGAVSTPKAAESQDETNDGEYVPTAEFTPVIPLPELVEVKTGEEGLEVLYEEHCKLFRFIEEQWKERGVGKMKILRDPKDGTIRLLMRRDQVHKVCCNQRLTASHELKAMSTTDKAWSWVGKDFSEGSLKDELLCVRFKTVELALAFKEAFNSAKARLSEMPAVEVAAPAAGSALPPLSQVYKRDQSMWECKECYVSNKKEDTLCAACQQPRDGIAQPAPAKSSLFSSGTTSFGFGAAYGSSSTSSVNPAAGSTTSTPSWSFGVPASAPTATKFTFGNLPVASTDATTAVNSSQGGTPAAQVFSFGNLQSQKAESGGPLFGNNSFLFGNQSTPSSKSAGSAVESPPEKKSAANSIFGGTGGNSFTKPGQSSSAFSNFSFKLPEKSNDDSLSITGSKEEKKFDSYPSKSSSPDDVVFVSETNIPDDEKRLATSLMLPPNYFAYKYSNKNCPGCVGCDEEDIKAAAKDLTKTVNPKESQVADSSLNVKIPSDSSTPASNPVKSESIFGFGGFSGSTLDGSWLKNQSAFNFSNIFNQSSNLSASESTPKKVAEEEDESDSEEKDTVVPNENDPHFEPIVPLPNLVETKTGEEDELIEFCERSKLFRYDKKAKEWKERGVGDLKILFHPDQKSFRLLLRREQVHKVVLNQRITSSFSLKPMSTNAKSWCWFGMNLPEESSEPVLEELAARFKTEEVAKSFENAVSQCLERLSYDQVGGENSTEAANSDASTEAPDDDQEYEVEEEDGYYNEDDYNEYDGQGYYVDEQALQDAMAELMFDAPATLTISEGNVSSDYSNGVVRLMKGKLDGDEEPLKSFLHFSTPDVPSLYVTEINRDSQTLWENDRVTILEDPEGERKVTIKFADKESSESFFSHLEAIQENDVS